LHSNLENFTGAGQRMVVDENSCEKIHSKFLNQTKNDTTAGDCLLLNNGTIFHMKVLASLLF
jgi:hypothetical protein